MKQFKLVRIILTEIESPPSTNLLELRRKMEQQQEENPNDDFKIVDSDGNVAEIDDFLEAEIAHPVAKAKRKQAALDDEYKAKVSKKLRRCG